MTPRRTLRWGPADKFRAPIPPGMSIEQAARKIEAEYAPALAALRDEVGTAYGIPPGSLPLAWFSDGGLMRCASCRTEVEQGPVLLRCPECGRVAARPAGWSP